MNSRIARHLVGLTAIVSSLVVAVPAAAQADTGCSQANSQAAAQKYLDALVDRNAAWSIPLDPFVLRIEDGIPTAVSALDLKLDLYAHVQYSVFQSIGPVTWTWQPGGQANVINATYVIPVGLQGVPLGSSAVTEDFTLTAGCKIKKIVATFTIDPPA